MTRLRRRLELGILAAVALALPCLGQQVAVEALVAVAPPATTVKAGDDLIPRHAPALRVEPMTFQDQGRYYIRHTFDPGSLLIPVLPAAITLSNPPRRYPRDWKDGGPAFGRNFGDSLAAATAARTGKFLACAALGEDPRYYPDTSRNGWHRIYHALAFTVVDSSTSGHRRFAFSNFAGAAAGGFVGMAYLPPGYDDLTHAGQRTGGMLGGYIPTQLVGFATQNLSSEFSPEMKWLARKLHIPFVH